MRRVCAALVAAAAAVWGGSFGLLPSTQRPQQSNASRAGRGTHAVDRGAAAPEPSQRAFNALRHVSRELRRSAEPGSDPTDLLFDRGAAPLCERLEGPLSLPGAGVEPERPRDRAAQGALAWGGKPQVVQVELEHVVVGGGHAGCSAPCQYKDKSPSIGRGLSTPTESQRFSKRGGVA